MKKLNLIILLFIVTTLIILVYTYKVNSDERKLEKCFDDVLNSINITTLNIDVVNRLNSPIISGKINSKQKKLFLDILSQNCKLQSFEDLIEVVDESFIKTSHINFTLDRVNEIASIKGMVNSSIEQRQILSNFTDSVNLHYGPWTIQHEILVFKEVERNEFAIDISLIFPAILLVKVTDITFIKNKLIVKGLVRNIEDKQQTLKKLNQLFQDELEIVDEIQFVTLLEEDFKGIEIDMDPIELLDTKPVRNN